MAISPSYRIEGTARRSAVGVRAERPGHAIASRIFALALLFGNGMGSSLMVTGAVAATRTLVYMSNDYLWNHLTALPPAPPRRAQTMTSR